MNGMEAYVHSQNVSPHEGIVGESVNVPTTTAGYPQPQANHVTAANHVVSAAAYAQTRLLVNGSHSKKMEN